jgi:hypothetical protein
MELKTKMCYSTLMSMLAQGAKFQQAIQKFTSSAPNFDGEGFNGYIEVEVIFYIKDLKLFSEIYEAGYVYPSERSKWYNAIKNNFTWK